MRTTAWAALALSAAAAGITGLAGCSSGNQAARAPAGSATQGAPASVAAESPTRDISSRVIGRLGAVLVDASGQTLYANVGEPRSTACDANCRRTWPLVLAPASLPAASGGAAQTLITAATFDGLTVVEYAGHPLHRYVGDSAAGEASGQGVQLMWAAVTTTGALATGYP